MPIVPCAILFDLLNGGDKEWKRNPYGQLGRQAFEAASADFEIGTAGAGTGATTLGLKGGLGSASAVTDEGFTVGALVAVNSAGSTVVDGGQQFWAAPFEIDGEFGGAGICSLANPNWEPELGASNSTPGENTAIAVVATDADLDQARTARLAAAAHAGLG